MRIIAVTVIAFSLVSGPAASHSWYPPECCHNQDCSEAIIKLLPDGKLEASSIHGTALIESSTRVLESRDSKPHVCIRSGRAVCFFLPPLN